MLEKFQSSIKRTDGTNLPHRQRHAKLHNSRAKQRCVWTEMDTHLVETPRRCCELNNSSVTMGSEDVPTEMQNLALCFIFGLPSCVIMSHSLPNYVGVFCLSLCLSVPSDCVCVPRVRCVFL